ncbi:MAG: hypothetical protein ING19_19185 [Azospirillum sp.]|nr:hypothetical protein [Azospirillum sp.]
MIVRGVDPVRRSEIRHLRPSDRKLSGFARTRDEESVAARPAAMAHDVSAGFGRIVFHQAPAEIRFRDRFRFPGFRFRQRFPTCCRRMIGRMARLMAGRMARWMERRAFVRFVCGPSFGDHCLLRSIR